MNWYRFKVELSAWAAKMALALLTTWVGLRVLFQPPDTVRYYPLYLRPLAENEWIIQLAFVLAVSYLWLAYWKIFRIYRGYRAYGPK